MNTIYDQWLLLIAILSIAINDIDIINTYIYIYIYMLLIAVLLMAINNSYNINSYY